MNSLIVLDRCLWPNNWLVRDQTYAYTAIYIDYGACEQMKLDQPSREAVPRVWLALRMCIWLLFATTEKRRPQRQSSTNLFEHHGRSWNRAIRDIKLQGRQDFFFCPAIANLKPWMSTATGQERGPLLASVCHGRRKISVLMVKIGNRSDRHCQSVLPVWIYCVKHIKLIKMHILFIQIRLPYTRYEIGKL
jgi:hypothetical protein